MITAARHKLAGALKSAATRLEYDAGKTSNKRRQSKQTIRHEDRVASAGKRRRFITSTRDVQRNFSIAAWAIRKHLDYVATFTFQPRTGEAAADRDLAEFIAEWSKPHNFDAAGRHDLHRFIRLTEERALVDGDVGLLKLGDNRVQAVESDKIRTRDDSLQDGSQVYHGVRVDKAGRAIGYQLHSRDDHGQYAFEREVRANRMLLHGYFDRFDQVRGISPLVSAVNTLQDVYEGFGYALSKAKVAQLFGLVFYRDAVEGGLNDNPGAGDSDGDGLDDETETDTTYEVSFDNGNVPVIDLEPGDRAEFLENKTPSTEFREFSHTMTGVALKALDIPLSFFDEAHTNYSGARQALLQYEQSAACKRRGTRGVLDQLTAWRVRRAMDQGELPTRAWRWEWVSVGLPWIRPLEETQADIAAIDAGLTTRTDVLRRQGRNWDEVAARLAEEREQMVALGLVSSESLSGAV